LSASTTGCPSCAAEVAQSGTSNELQYPVWRCPCGAVGVGASPMDIDEALDELEALLSLRRGTFGMGAPASPAGTSGLLHATYIDPPAIVAGAIASAPPGWQVGSSRAMRGTWELLVIWARPTAASG
jgi:hypothetical protein